ncbi:hypothetical protein [Streptomyces canus]|uniref:hypothetical protein n=1 Tax=Streptomyces canus TaxID=58343 RepID=UPI0027838F5C|nr:hypothetical protein [Streptomyces canus]MDQ0765164.1 hypothetical protein [Streptomyces canus]
MRRTARLRALSVVLPALGVTLGVAPPIAFAEPAAEVSPSSVQPGGSVTVSVSCDPGTGTPPATVDATSEAFETQTVRLQLVPGDDDKVSGPAYSGTARIAADQELQEGAGGVGPDSAWTVDGTCPTADRAPGPAWSATFTVARGPAADSSHRPCTEPRTEPRTEPQTEPRTEPRTEPQTEPRTEPQTEPRTEPRTEPQTEPRTEPRTEPQTEPRTEPRTEPQTEPRTEPRTESCDTAVIQSPVHAGQGGSFTDSVPALAAGALLIAGAAAGAVHRLRRKSPAADA